MKKKLLAALAVGVIMLGMTGVASATTVLTTDASWRVTPITPGSGWNNQLAFNDSSWENATVISSSDGRIWSSGGQYSSTETQIWARRTFTLDSIPTSATLSNGFDDDGDLYVNGTQVISDHDGWAHWNTVDVSSYLVKGNNFIAFTASDNYPMYGYNHCACVKLDAELPPPSQTPVPGAVWLFGSGLAGLVGLRRTKKD